ncbi:hypothetical protein ACQ4PT_020154 [Festuca glaucescens]
MIFILQYVGRLEAGRSYLDDGRNATVANSVSLDDGSKITLQFCVKRPCEFREDCYCCNTLKTEPCFVSLEECQASCPACNGTCPPPQPTR